MESDTPNIQPTSGESPPDLPQVNGSPEPSHVPLHGGFPIVGIGASAGGLAAFESFFRSLPPDSDCDMAFVLVQHLAPDHKSILVELLRKYTRMQVFEVEDGMRVLPNCVYVIPPNHELAIMHGTLQLLQPIEPRGQRLPIDFFFESLAQDQRQLAIGLILSGTGSDGSQGVRAIKNEGGMVMVQSPDTTEFDGMPTSAIKTGAVDFISDVSDMPAQLAAYVARAFDTHPGLSDQRTAESENAIQKILLMVRAHTGHDFSLYKPSTIDRRIERRMAVSLVNSLNEYVKKLQQSPIEVEALFYDLLIGVTHFFRDSEAFEKLETLILPPLIAEKSASGAALRVWVGGCSTGEEAYSIAILLHEQMESLRATLGTTVVAQVFASDIDPRAIASARAGLYPKSIADDVSPARLSRYFTFEPDNDAFRIHKRIREMVVFSEHDIIKDPPFSKIDLISCRNLMIYFCSELQRKIVALFHFALNPNGVLFLGSSEGIGDFEPLFTAIDRKAKLYRRHPDFEGTPRATLHRTNAITFSPIETRVPRAEKPLVKLPLRELAEQTLLALLAPAAAIVNEKGDILYLLGRTGSFLEPAAGESSVSNIIKMAREGLRHQLAAGLHKAVSTQQTVRIFNLLVKTNGHFAHVNVCICLANGRDRIARKPGGLTSNDQMYLVLLEESNVAPTRSAKLTGVSLDTNMRAIADANDVAASPSQVSEALIDSLYAELQAKDEYLQSVYEELDTANGKLRVSNEEMQSVNEELQSTNEELETSKEELQSINEELSTVNSELQNKITDLSRLNNDMNNLLAGSGIATIFVDQTLRIVRFTPTMAQIINLINTDVGRPIGHVVSNFVGYDCLVADAQLVLDTLEPQVRRVQTTNGLWFQMRIKPYRTVENFIDGVVITFADITEIKRSEVLLEKANRQLRLAVVVRDASDAITVHDLEGRIIAWNPSAVRIYGWSEEEALQMNVGQRIPEKLRKESLSEVARLSQAEILIPYKTQRLTKSGSILNVFVSATALVNDSGLVYAIATTERLEAQS